VRYFSGGLLPLFGYPAPMSTISPEHREWAVRRLEEIADELGQISTWLSLGDEDRAAIMLEESYRNIEAAAHVVQRRIRTRPAGWLNGHGYSENGPQRG